jgi:SAM-dependent methyltransferase
LIGASVTIAWNMYWCQVDRDRLLHFLPKGGTVAEVGVFAGAYSIKIAQTCNPAKLFLIDKWDFADPNYKGPTPSPAQRHADAVFAGVQRDFGARIAAGQVQMVRADSLAAAAQFQPATFDWVYIDCDHRYPAVLADLEAYARVLKPDGLLLGHDFEERTFEPAARGNFGVTDAVRDFIRTSGFEMLLMTAGLGATYCLTRNPAGAIARGIIASLLASSSAVVDMGDIARIRFHWDSVTVDGKTILYRRIEYVG